MQVATVQHDSAKREMTRTCARQIAWVVGFAVALVLSAQVRFYAPGSAVPVTLQTAVVLLAGFWLRPKLAAGAVALYLAAGFTLAGAAPGLAVFAAFAAGKAATLGYLIGFLPAAALVSALVGQFARLTFGRALAIGLVGMTVMFACGLAWLTVLTGSAVVAVQQGLAPFVVWALVKTGVVAALASAAPLRR
ncbi:MAG: biotin transporter BioY [Phycisphaerales bacterium]|nr:biotin transporter BioY [Phycisphaerales bacterium]